MPPRDPSSNKRAAPENGQQFTNYRNPSMCASSRMSDGPDTIGSNAAHLDQWNGQERSSDMLDQRLSIDHIPLDRLKTWGLDDLSEAALRTEFKKPRTGWFPSPGAAASTGGNVSAAASAGEPNGTTAVPISLNQTVPQTVVQPTPIPVLIPAVPMVPMLVPMVPVPPPPSDAPKDRDEKRKAAVRNFKASKFYLLNQTGAAPEGKTHPLTPRDFAMNKRPWERSLAEWRTDWKVIHFIKMGYDETQVRSALKEFYEEQKGKDHNQHEDDIIIEEIVVKLAKLQR